MTPHSIARQTPDNACLGRVTSSPTACSARLNWCGEPGGLQTGAAPPSGAVETNRSNGARQNHCNLCGAVQRMDLRYLGNSRVSQQPQWQGTGMQRIRGTDTNLLQYQEGNGGCVALAGLPFLVCGIFGAIPAVFGGLTSGGNAAGLGTRFLVLCFSLIFGAFGSVLTLGQMGLVFDRNQRTLTRWFGLRGRPLWRQTHDTGLFHEVSISEEVQTSQSSEGTDAHSHSRTVYPVRLQGERTFDVTRATDVAEARRLGEELAKFLNLGLVDARGGETTRRESGTLDEPLRDRLRSLDAVTRTPRPDDARSTVRQDGARVVRIEIPPPQVHLEKELVVAGLITLAASYVVLSISPSLTGGPEKPTPALAGWVILAIFLGLPRALDAFRILSRFSRLTVVEASPEVLRVVSHGLLRTRAREMPVGELEVLRLQESAGTPSLVATSDRHNLQFGVGLSRAELAYLRDEISRAISR